MIERANTEGAKKKRTRRPGVYVRQVSRLEHVDGKSGGRTEILPGKPGCHEPVPERFKGETRPHVPEYLEDVGPGNEGKITDEGPYRAGDIGIVVARGWRVDLFDERHVCRGYTRSGKTEVRSYSSLMVIW